MNEIYYFIISYVAIILLFLFLTNWLSSGFLIFFIRAKMSRGRKVLVINRGMIESYASLGWLEGNHFCYFDRETKRKEKNKVSKRLTVQEGTSPFFRLFGVTVVMIDEKTNNFILPNGDVKNGFDAIKQENLLLWALQRPRDTEKLLIWLIVIMVAVILVLMVSGMSVYKLNQLQSSINLFIQSQTVVQGTNIV